MNTTTLFLKSVVVEQKLGSGKYGEVYKGSWHGTTAVALKKLKDTSPDSAVSKEFENEMTILIKLNHPNIVRFLGLFHTDSDLYMVMEYLSKGSLLDFLSIDETKRILVLNDLLHMTTDIAAGMGYLASQNIVHRDLAARNLLVTQSDGRFTVKIADLGLSRQVENDVYHASDKSFPVKWSPPEVIEHRQFTTKSDVWSFGVAMWEIFEFGKIPYPALSNTDTVDYVLSGKRLPQPKNCPDEIFQIMQQCWLSSPQERPTFKILFEDLLQYVKQSEGTPPTTTVKRAPSTSQSHLYGNTRENGDVYNNTSSTTAPNTNYN